MIVKDIKFINNKVRVTLDDTVFFMSKENYIENPLTIDSNVDQQKLDYLKEYENIIEVKQYLIKLLNRKALSEYEVYLKIKEKEVDNKNAKIVIDSLKRAGLINDEFVAGITVESELVKRRGKRNIIKALKEKRINEDTIDRVIGDIDEDMYLDNFNRVVNKYLKMYDKKSQKVKEGLLRQKLEELGYERELVNDINIEKDSNTEMTLAKETIIKIIKSKRMDLSNYENINKIKTKLVMKGFSYDIINMALEEVKCDETY